MGLRNKWSNNIEELKDKITTKVTSVSWRDEGAGCSDCGGVVGPGLGEVRSGTGFPGAGSCLEKVSCGTLSSEGGGGGGGGCSRALGREWKGPEGGAGREGATRKPLWSFSTSLLQCPLPSPPPCRAAAHLATLRFTNPLRAALGGPHLLPCTAPLPPLKEAHPAGADTALASGAPL